MSCASEFFVPKDYRSRLRVLTMQKAIKVIKDLFEKTLAEKLKLTRVSAPFFVEKNSGLNDLLNGTERPVEFTPLFDPENHLEIIQSLAKWKRLALQRYDIPTFEGLYTDMNAIRRDERLDNMHSIYVDQWDFEIRIERSLRNVEYLKGVVRQIYQCIREVERTVLCQFPDVGKSCLPEQISFVTSQELENEFPQDSPSQRENLAAKRHGAIFIMQIGKTLLSGSKHDSRSPDYDDWEMNGDIILWCPLLKRAFEICSMGIRVDAEAMRRQCALAQTEDRLTLPFHQMVLKDEVPLSLGGGIGQSRLCMYILQTAHIGEVQASVWDEATLQVAREHQINIL